MKRLWTARHAPFHGTQLGAAVPAQPCWSSCPQAWPPGSPGPPCAASPPLQSGAEASTPAGHGGQVSGMTCLAGSATLVVLASSLLSTINSDANYAKAACLAYLAQTANRVHETWHITGNSQDTAAQDVQSCECFMLQDQLQTGACNE